MDFVHVLKKINNTSQELNDDVFIAIQKITNENYYARNLLLNFTRLCSNRLLCSRDVNDNNLAFRLDQCVFDIPL